MASTADAVIIGGGVMGCSILYNLAERGVTNTLLLERDVLASGSTSRSQAILRMHYSNEVTTRLSWDSLSIFKDFHEITGVPSGYTKTGYFIIVGPEDRRAMEENVAMQRSVGVDTSALSQPRTFGRSHQWWKPAMGRRSRTSRSRDTRTPTR